MKMLAPLSRVLERFRRKENGGSTVELAIVFPILLLLFVGAAELGRLFYTYTTLAKATKTGARYLSNSRDFTSSDTTTAANAALKAKSMVVCGYEDCTNKTMIIDGLGVGNVSLTQQQLTEGGVLVNYVTVQIVGYTYQRGVFTIAGVTGAADSVFYKALSPKTRMRYMF